MLVSATIPEISTAYIEAKLTNINIIILKLTFNFYFTFPVRINCHNFISEFYIARRKKINCKKCLSNSKGKLMWPISDVFVNNCLISKSLTFVPRNVTYWIVPVLRNVTGTNDPVPLNVLSNTKNNICYGRHSLE